MHSRKEQNSKVERGSPELEYYVYGFYRVLKRYRSVSIAGWTIVAVALASMPLGWDFSRGVPVWDIALTGLAVAAGIALVWHRIVALDEYIHIPFQSTTGNAADEEMKRECLELMKEVDNGGWQEAFAALQKLRALQVRYGLPPLE